MAYQYGTPRRPQCCCGQQDCAFLAHTCQTLEGLERDVRTAAELGQALAARHEAYMADAEAERERMSSSIERLEQEKRDLEVKNATTIEENRYLLNQLESLNNTIAESDVYIKSLDDTLSATQQELHRLTVLAARAEVLEKQLWQLETDQQELREKLEHTEEDERSAVQRWKQAERTIASLHDQIERIEREAREETERHAEVVERMEKRGAVERELQANGGRLRPVETPRRPDHRRQGSGVVTHFVKDILQDNANLQAGIVELREMLLNSNVEVERLRQQLMVHQPIDQPIDDDESAPTTPSLMEELESKKAKAPELHVHHHYHAPAPGSSKARTPLRHTRPKKKRYATPPSVYHTARSSIASISSVRGEPTTPSSESAILSNTAVSIPTRHKPRWSMQSGMSAASSSLPSSPYSDYRRTSSIFDRGSSDAGIDSSRPTSAGSTECESPMFERVEPLGLPPFPVRTKSSPGGLQPKSRASLPSVTMNNNFVDVDDEPSTTEPELTDRASTISPSVIPEEPEDFDTSATPTIASDMPSPDFFPLSFSNNKLRRANSHDSLLSISGMDIHTLKSRPSQLLTAGASLSSKPVLSAITTTAVVSGPSNIRRSDRNGLQTLKGSLLSGNAADQRSTSGGGRRGWGWGWSKWISNTPATVETTLTMAATRPLHARKPSTASARSADSIQRGKAAPAPKLRPPGINQAGPIFGLGPEPPTPYQPKADLIDEDALREGLLER